MKTKNLSYADKLDWDDLKIVLAVCRGGSLSAAARVLGTSHSTVFRQINAIEDKFATRFFNRLPHGYEMTDAGELLLRVASNIEEDILDLKRELQGKDLRLQGNIRLTAPDGISFYLLPPHLASFHQLHPDINIELIVSPTDLQLARGEADLALRITKNPPQNSIAKKVCDFRMAFYASKSYLKKVKDRQLRQYDFVLCSHYYDAVASHLWKNTTPPSLVFTSANVLAAANAAKEGMGATVLPCFIGENEKKLQRLSPPVDAFTSELWLLTHADLRQTARVRALMTHLHDCLQKQRALIEARGL